LRQKIIREFFFLFAFPASLISQVSLDIVEYRPFPEKIMILDLKPDLINWSIANQFILLDKSRQELIGLGPFGDIIFSSSFGLRSQRYGDLIWVGNSASGIWIVDRLENQITLLDYQLNPITSDGFEPRIFPEHAAIGPWGKVYLYSNQYNSIFLYDQKLEQQPFIDLNRVIDFKVCLMDIEINQEGELAILDCDGNVHLFNKLGRFRNSYPSKIKSANFIVASRNKWFVFNIKGEGKSIFDHEIISIPGASIPVLDIASMNRSIAVLSNDHILVLNVKTY
tara:strand:- start:14909 stop:15751 length:843 start_codon:yes stop_codon:yes gene_type:complete